MKRLTFGVIFLVMQLSVCQCFALDWKTVHETADRTDLRTALRRVENDPASVKDLYILGLVYLEMYQPRKAEDAFDRIITIAPQSKEGLWGKAEVLRMRHEYAKAEGLLEGIIRDYPDFFPAYLSMACIRFIQARFHDAANFALIIVRREIGEIDTTTYARAHLIYAGAKGMIAHFGGPMSRLLNGFVVMPTLHDAQNLKPDSPEVLYGFGCYYLLAPRGMGKNIRLAKYYLERVVDDEPLFSDGFARLAQVYKMNGDLRKYNELLDAALELDPQSELALDIKNNTCRFICPDKTSANR
jgi:tetratricopeptide (TPR) repeat protein